MSSFAAFVAALAVLIVLGAIAAYLLNVSLWAVAAVSLGLLIALVRFVKRRAEKAAGADVADTQHRD